MRHNQDKRCSFVPSPWRVSDINWLPLWLVYSTEALKRHRQFAFFIPSEGIQTCRQCLLHELHRCYDNCRCLNPAHTLLLYSCAFADVAHLLSYKVSPCSSQVSAHVHVHRRTVMFPCLLSLRALHDWFHHKIVLSSQPLKLWSHRYVCAAIAVRGTELFTSSFCSYSLAPDVVLYPFFLALLIYSPSIPGLSLIPTFFHPPVLALPTNTPPPTTSLCLLSSSSHSSSISHPPISLTTPFLSSISALCLSPVLSALGRFSAITPLHLLIPVLIQPSTHSCLASKYTTLANIHARTPYAHVRRLHKCPPRSLVCPHAHAPLTVQKNALCERTASINLPTASVCALMLFTPI